MDCVDVLMLIIPQLTESYWPARLVSKLWLNTWKECERRCPRMKFTFRYNTYNDSYKYMIFQSDKLLHEYVVYQNAYIVIRRWKHHTMIVGGNKCRRDNIYHISIATRDTRSPGYCLENPRNPSWEGDIAKRWYHALLYVLAEEFLFGDICLKKHIMLTNKVLTQMDDHKTQLPINFSQI